MNKFKSEWYDRQNKYCIELREYTESGDYIENDYWFSGKQRKEAFQFAVDNKKNLHMFLDYQDRDYDPKDLTHLV